MRIGIGAETHALLLEPLDQSSRGEVFGAIESHVLQEVSHAALTLGLRQRSDVDMQAQVNTLLRFRMGRPSPAHPIFERAVVNA